MYIYVITHYLLIIQIVLITYVIGYTSTIWAMAAATLNEGLSDQKCCWDLGGFFLAITWFKFSLAFEEPRKFFFGIFRELYENF